MVLEFSDLYVLNSPFALAMTSKVTRIVTDNYGLPTPEHWKQVVVGVWRPHTMTAVAALSEFDGPYQSQLQALNWKHFG